MRTLREFIAGMALDAEAARPNLSTDTKLARGRDRGTARSKASIKHPMKPVSLPAVGMGKRKEAKEERS